MINKYFKRILFLLICAFTFANLMGQDDCVIKLNEAQKLYENGKIEKIPDLLNDCIESGFNRENKIQGLRLLTLVYLFEDNTIKAEKTLLSLLKIDPEYKINQAIDPLEFIRLFNSFNTAPVFSMGIVAAPMLTMPHLIETFGPAAFNEANPKYSASGISFSVGLKGNYHINSAWDLSFEPSFSNLTFQLQENVGTVNRITITENMKYLNFPVFGSYTFYKKKKYQYYGEVGFSYDMFLSGNINGNNEYNESQKPGTEPGQIETIDLRNEYNMMGSVGLGTKIAMNRSNIQVALRYKFGVLNVANGYTRETENYGYYTSSYQDIDNDFTINNLCFMISFNWEFYRHKKKPNNQTNYDVIK